MTDDPTTARSTDLDSLLGRVADDFLVRQERGEAPDPEEYAARHPEAADLIRRALGSLRLVESAGDGPPPPGGPPVAGVLGDFRIVREVGRGGMGVVYEAEQLSLRRRVALKVLPFAAVMDPRSLQRFRNEALAAAGLDHPHVVKVHAVGQDRGVHYLAMQFVEGRSLADLIADRRGDARPAGPQDPTTALAAEPTAPAKPPSGSRPPADAAYLRRAAEWGAQAADALEHAHALGVVHRDVKPANLLVDGRGHLYVADFGLAQVAADPGLTATGDVLGTPRYMSPEQAGARHNLVDHRTDVYALGATLYELLTLAPAVPGDTRAEVLRRVAEADPARPRALDRRVPWDLETVVLKCLEKDPARRYPSAKELADDLRRFLTGDPVKAKRPTARQRLGRWAGRHPKAVAAGVVLLLLGLGAFAVWDRERARADGAARQAADQAADLYARRRLTEAEAVARRAANLLPRFGDPELRRRVTDLAADLALVRRLDAARQEYVVMDPMGRDPDTGRTAAQFAAAFRDEYGLDVLGWDEAAVAAELGRRAVRAELVVALEDWGADADDPAVKARLERLADALDPDGREAAGRVRRAVRDGDAADLRQLAAAAEADLPPLPAVVRLARGLRRVKAREDAVRLLRAGLRRHPDDLMTLVRLADALALGALEAGKVDPAAAAEAARFYTAALALRPESPVILYNLGLALRQAGRSEEALAYLRLAEAARPDSPLIQGGLGTVLGDLGRTTEAVEAYRRAVGTDRGSSVAWFNLGLEHSTAGRPAEAIDPLRTAAALKPEGDTYSLLGNCLNEVGRFAEAEAAARESVRLAPDDARGHGILGEALHEQGRHAEAAVAFRRAAALSPGAQQWYQLGVALNAAGDPGGAEAAYRAAIQADSGHAEAHCNLGDVLRQRGQLRESLDAVRRGHELGSKRPDWEYPSAEWVREAEALAARVAPPPRPVAP